MNFCISANSLTKKYECKTTHSATPFLKVDTQYLDLTTKTTSGLNIKVKHNNITYRPLQTATSTSSRSSQYVSTTMYSGYSTSVFTSEYSGISSRSSTSVYSGVSKRTSTSGYSGSSTRTSTSLYSGICSTTYTVTQTSGYSMVRDANTLLATSSSTAGNIGFLSYGTYLRNSSTFTSSTTISNTVVYFLTCYSGGSLTAGPAGTLTLSNTSTAITCSSTRWANKSMYMNYPASLTIWPDQLSAAFRGQRAMLTATRHSQLLTGIYLSSNDTGKKRTITTSNGSHFFTSSLYTNSKLSQTTALTRKSTYQTSSTAIGNMSSTTALTRTSAYTTTNSIANNLSSITALTCSSTYNTTVIYSDKSKISDPVALTKPASVITTATIDTIFTSIITVFTKTMSRSSQYNIITEI